MKVLIIGSKGFIGQHVVDHFSSSQGVSVFACDVMVDYVTENYFLIDATNADYEKIFRKQSFDICINCSGAASVPASIQDPLRDFTLNTYNVVKILDAIRSNQPSCKFVNLSSAAVYGNPGKIPISERDTPSPISPYGTHKLYAEQICKMYNEMYGISTCSLRIFSAYGEGLKKQLFWDLFKKANQADTFEMFGTGEESRDFIHVDDVVRAIHISVDKAQFQGETINIANGEEIRIKDAVSTFLSFFPVFKSAKFNHIVKEGDPLYWKADIAILSSMGYTQSVSLKKGLENYYTWINQL